MMNNYLLFDAFIVTSLFHMSDAPYIKYLIVVRFLSFLPLLHIHAIYDADDYYIRYSTRIFIV